MLTLPPTDKNKLVIWGTEVDFGKKKTPSENQLEVCLKECGKRGWKVLIYLSFWRFGRWWDAKGLSRLCSVIACLVRRGGRSRLGDTDPGKLAVSGGGIVNGTVHLPGGEDRRSRECHASCVRHCGFWEWLYVGTYCSLTVKANSDEAPATHKVL